MNEVDWKAVHRLEEAAASATRAADRIEEAARRIGQQFEPGYGGRGERLIELLEDAKPAVACATSAIRDMLDSARSDLDVIRNALGVPVEPHQSLLERMVEATQAKRGAVPEWWKPMPVNGSYELARAFREAETAALLSGHDHIEAFHCGYRALIAAAPAPASADDASLSKCQARLFDVLVGDDGQAWAEAERYLETVRPDLFAALRREAQPAKCDGNHGGPRCADPECWNDVAPIENGDDIMGGAA